MAVYIYKAKTFDGQIQNGLVEAPTEQAASHLIRDKGLYIISLSVQAKQISLDSISNRFKKITFDDTVSFTRQMATLAVAGLSLPESLSLLRSQSDNPVYVDLLADIEHQIVGGGTLASALGRHPEVFTRVYVSLIKAGEASGRLDKILVRLAETLENQKEFNSKIKGVMIYPAIIVIGMVAVVFIMMTVVLPKLTDLYKDFGVSLPLSTQILINTSNFFVQFWWLMIIVMVGGGYLFNRWRKTDVGELLIDKVVLKIPIFGPIQQQIVIAEFSRTLGMLITAGIHILDGLNLIQDSMGNVLYRDTLREIAKKIEKGFPMGDTFAQYPIFPPLVSQMIKVGEETGKLDETLSKLANYFEKETEYSVKNLTTAMEPIIMIVLGLGVGFIVFSIITPIYSITTQIK